MGGKTLFEAVCGILGGIAGFMFGAADGLVYALIAFAALDYVSGIIAAAIRRELSSRVGFDGIFRKIMIFILLALANIVDMQVTGGGGALRSAVAAFFLANEGISILENASRAGLPVPQKLRCMLKKIGGDDE